MRGNDLSDRLPEIALHPHFRENQDALLRALLQASDYGILLTGLDRQDILANRRLGELFSCAPEDVVETAPENVRALVHARVRDPEAFEDLLCRTYADPLLSYEDELELATDPPRILRRFTGPVMGRNGEPLGRLWTFLDITEMKRLQAEVQSQLVARTADFHATQEVLQAMNDLCRLPTQHQSTTELQAAISKRVTALVGAKQSAVLLSQKGENSTTIPPGSDAYRVAQWKAVTDQVALTLETHRLQSELHQAMLTLQQTQRRLVEMEKLRTAGTLAASVAHDIRNILTTMRMELETLPEPAAASLCDQLNRFSALTHRLLAFARPNILETHPTRIDEVIGRIIPLMAGQAEINEVEILLEMPAEMPPVAADSSQLEHLFVNLCLNAIQAMPRGGTLTLRAGAEENWLKITVTDTGCGIAPDAMHRLFDPFFTTRANGVGLGLFSCKRIVEEHGGEITALNLPEQGSQFRVLFPLMPQG